MAKNAKKSGTKKSGTKKSAAKAAPIRKGGKSALVEPQLVHEDDIDPRHQWKRPLQAPGHTQVDFEERVNFRRLHGYRVARVREALAGSGLGALLSFDQHNIRYTTSTVIGEWARDKLLRYSLITGNGDPYIWDFGSAAKHHKLYAPWLHNDHCRAGMLGMRGAVGSDITLFRDAAREIKAILDAEGVGDMPSASTSSSRRCCSSFRRPASRCATASRRCCTRARSRATTRSRCSTWRPRWSTASTRTSRKRSRRASRRARSSRSRRAALRDGLGLRRGDQLDLGRTLLAASAQLHGPSDPPGRPGVLRCDPLVHRLSHVLLPHVLGRPRDACAAHRVPQGARVDGPHHRAAEARHGQRRGRARSADGRRIGFPSEIDAFGLNFCHGLGLGLHERPLISRVTSFRDPIELKVGMVFAVETYCPATDGISAARIEEEVVLTPDGAKIITLFPAEDLPVANPY